MWYIVWKTLGTVAEKKIVALQRNILIEYKIVHHMNIIWNMLFAQVLGFAVSWNDQALIQHLKVPSAVLHFKFLQKSRNVVNAISLTSETRTNKSWLLPCQWKAIFILSDQDKMALIIVRTLAIETWVSFTSGDKESSE